MACKVYRLLKSDLIDVVGSSVIGSEQYDHNVMPDFIVREETHDDTVIYLRTVPPSVVDAEGVHSPIEFRRNQDDKM